MEKWLPDCERAYYECFCASERIPGGTRFYDAQIADMYDHNFTLADEGADVAALYAAECAHRRSLGAGFCKLVLPMSCDDARAALGDAECAAAELSGLMVYAWPGTPLPDARGDVRLIRYGDADAARLSGIDPEGMRAALLASDIEQYEPDMHDFVRRRLARREQVYLAEGGVDCFLAYVGGECVGSCDMLTAGGTAKFEDFNVRPAFQRQGIGGAVLCELIRRATARGATRFYLCTDADDTAWQMYEKRGFKHICDFTDVMRFF